MMRFPLLFAGALVLVACTSRDAPSVAEHRAASTPVATASAQAPRAARTIANLPDRGQLLTYARTEPVRRTAYAWHPASLSEAHALRAIATGTMVLEAPNGTPIRLRYARHIEHPDGNWTWIGRPDGAKPGTDAIITFGEKAVFGSVPNGDGPPLRITTTGGRTWVMETDPRALKRMVAAGMTPDGADFATLPQLAGARDKVVAQAAIAPQKLTASGAVPESATVDIAIGYTDTFASRLGGTSQALTRLRYLIEVGNLALSNSQIVGALRLAGTVALDYPDATDNSAALDAVSGVVCTDTNCEDAPIPAALMPLHDLREAVGADLISLVRNFSDPENDSCGIAWLLGSRQEAITPAMAWAGVSVVSDSNGNQFPDNDFICRDETFVHEVAHNMGSAHDEATAQGGDGVTDPEDYGRYPYSFGYKTTVGNFYTIMAYRDEGQTPYRVFSNPRITICDNHACGTTNADNARSLGQTMPVIAQFFAAAGGPARRADFDGDGLSDLLWRNQRTGANVYWRAANSASVQTMTVVANTAWKIVGSGDFNADGDADVLWRNSSSGQNSIWYSGLGSTSVSITSVPLAWSVAGVGDFNGDGRSDILWRNVTTGQNSLWRSGSSSSSQYLSTVAGNAWRIVGVADFDADGVSDILWRNFTTGANAIWRSANGTTTTALTKVANFAWIVAAVGDFTGDGRADILWRNPSTAQNQLWRSGSSASIQAMGTAVSTWKVATVADFNGDGVADVFWRNSASGAGSIWRSANSATSQSVSTVANKDWVVAP